MKGLTRSRYIAEKHTYLTCHDIPLRRWGEVTGKPQFRILVNWTAGGVTICKHVSFI